MPRQRNTRPTNIYWLYDTRPETVAVFGPDGQPFYCGKTVRETELRFAVHRWSARKYPSRPHSIRIIECGEHIALRIIEVVPVEGDWAARERFWIATLRVLYPGGTNIGIGGEGCPGYIPTAENREKARQRRIHMNKSPEARARTSAAQTGRKKSPETCAKISASKTGKFVVSPEHRAKISAFFKGRKRPPEECAKISAGLRGKKHSPERCAQNSALRRGVKLGPRSLEHRAKMSAIRTAYWAAWRLKNARA